MRAALFFIAMTSILMSCALAAAQDSDPCAVITCSGHGHCVVIEGRPACACEEGYTSDESRLNCVVAPPLPQPTPPTPTPAPPQQNADTTPQTTAPPQPAPAPAEAGPTPGQRRIEVRSNPPGMVIAMDSLPGLPGPLSAGSLQTTPHTYETSDTAHSFMLNAPGYERAAVAVEAGTQDLLVNVEMSRPVFEAGVGLFVIGLILSTVGAVYLGIGAADASERRAEYDPDTRYWLENVEAYCEWEVGTTNCWAGGNIVMSSVFMGNGGTFLLSGILMMALDRQRAPSFSVTEAPSP